MTLQIAGEVMLSPGAVLRGRFQSATTTRGVQLVVDAGCLVGTLEGFPVQVCGTLVGRRAAARQPEARRRRWLRAARHAGVVVILSVVSAGLAALASDYRHLHRQRDRMAALERRMAEEEVAITTFHRRLGAMRTEVATWRDLRVQIWEPFGPKGRSARPDSGIGGSAAPEMRPAGRSLDDELEQLVADVAEEGASLRALARLMARAGRALASLPSHWPLAGTVNSEFGRRRSPWTGAPEHHRGLDIDAREGTPVKAPAPGTVVEAGPLGEYGMALMLDHGNGVRSVYAHLDTPLARRGQRVERGQVIGLTGNTGRSSGPHLHYEVRVQGRPVNPRSFLWER